MRAGAVQLNATDDTDRNLETADRLVREAAAPGAELVVLPEKWTVLGTREQMPARRAAARRRRASTWARDDRARARASTWSPARSSSARRAREDSPTRASTSAPTARCEAVYRKLHMFDVEVDGHVYAESATRGRPGDEVVVSRAAPAASRLGHDHLLRPPLPRAVPDARDARRAGASPSPRRSRCATTRDHWEVLLRARAIENQCFVVAAQPDRRAPAGQPRRAGAR